ncbi:hypothetical protein OVY01_10805 [Robbsia sp. Bb-Pol-6]|uniref:Uncharacterized protein n=1 Tax=Robbsia betulipollinis TaxID=2981849 RepID=A0ABT3ZMG7_9BURK|nr:hypothetical protein [Robbsia betulipollinis]MCY0387715.1 hypothetical protein [Robbsia betulipollinis]
MTKATWLAAATLGAGVLLAGALPSAAQAQTMHFGEGQSNISDAPPPHHAPPPRHHRRPPPPPRPHHPRPPHPPQPL